ncbi:MAG: DNA-protecting protein DprA [Ruminiclostridium sp.]|nr:DNA-protecting protein DprA [Ruminiclostridium sp.]
MSTVRHWLWLSTRGKLPERYAARILDHFGTPDRAYHADQAAYDAITGLPEPTRQALLNKDLTEVDWILQTCQELGIRILTIQDAEYPERLRQIQNPPCVLYVKGQLPALDEEVAIAVVGARDASPYGIMAAQKLGLDLARQGALVISGSARGIDSAALKGALMGGGRVISVLGNGIDVIYPAGSRDLYDDVAVRGALISEYPPGTEPRGTNFPPRNRILAGLSLGVVVVEGTETSGSLITARLALEEDRDVFAVPGAINSALSKGPNSLIRKSEARLVRDAWDILEEYEFLYPDKIHPEGELPPQDQEARLHAYREETIPAVETERKVKKAEKPALEPQEKSPGLIVDLREDPEALTDDEAALIRALQGGVSLTADDLVELTEIPARRVMSALTMLQVRQLAEQGTGKRFSTPILLKE